MTFEDLWGQLGQLPLEVIGPIAPSGPLPARGGVIGPITTGGQLGQLLPMTHWPNDRRRSLGQQLPVTTNGRQQPLTVVGDHWADGHWSNDCQW